MPLISVRYGRSQAPGEIGPTPGCTRLDQERPPIGPISQQPPGIVELGFLAGGRAAADVLWGSPRRPRKGRIRLPVPNALADLEEELSRESS